ncbi:MAG: hypothetical protein AAFQ43_05115, partial [Bacteroidota bacterium]
MQDRSETHPAPHVAQAHHQPHRQRPLAGVPGRPVGTTEQRGPALSCGMRLAGLLLLLAAALAARPLAAQPHPPQLPD